MIKVFLTECKSQISTTKHSCSVDKFISRWKLKRCIVFASSIVGRNSCGFGTDTVYFWILRFEKCTHPRSEPSSSVRNNYRINFGKFIVYFFSNRSLTGDNISVIERRNKNHSFFSGEIFGRVCTFVETVSGGVNFYGIFPKIFRRTYFLVRSGFRHKYFSFYPESMTTQSNSLSMISCTGTYDSF